MTVGPWPLTGRSAELERLGGLFREGASAGVILVGPAGVGKTRLAEEALRLAEKAGRRVARAVGHPAAQAIPLGALAHVLPAQLVRDLGVGEDERTALFHAARAELRTLAGDDRLVLLVDDIELLDDTSVAVLVPLIVARSVFLVGTLRTGRSTSPQLTVLHRDGHLVRIDLEPLSTDAAIPASSWVGAHRSMISPAVSMTVTSWASLAQSHPMCTMSTLLFDGWWFTRRSRGLVAACSLFGPRSGMSLKAVTRPRRVEGGSTHAGRQAARERGRPPTAPEWRHQPKHQPLPPWCTNGRANHGAPVSPEELATVERSWSDLRRRKSDVLEHVASSLDGFDDEGPSELSRDRPRWLIAAVGELVGLLSCPSRLASRARELAQSWPVAETMPCFAIEGRAWMAAVHDVGVESNERVETAWHHAWLLLSEVLADEALSPFASPAARGAAVSR